MFLPPLSMSIDLITLAYSKIKSRIKKHDDIDSNKSLCSLEKKVSVFIPAFNEGEKLNSTVDCILNQTYPPKDVYILDDLSTDATARVCKELERKYENVHHIRRNEKLGKAGNINALVKEKAEELGDYVLVVDGDVKLERNCLEELAKSSDDAAIVTGFGYTNEPSAYIPKMLYEGESWINSVFSFRKKAQDIRKGIFVICGALSLYDKKVLKKIPIPARTLTEDTDYTWLVQEEGYKVKYTDKAKAVGNNPNTFKGYWKRYVRWFSGTFQGLYTHGRELNKSRPLLYSTILPGALESIPYSIAFSSLPVLACFSPELAEGVLAADLVLSAPFLFFHPKGFWHGLNHLPDIYAYKYFGSVACLYTGIKTTAEKILGKKKNWRNNWINSSQAEIDIKDLDKKYMKQKFNDFVYLEKEWTGLGEKAWDRDNFFYELPKKWKLSTCASANGKPVGYAIVSQPDKNKKHAFLHKILVDSDYQGLRIGSKLFVNTAYKCKREGMEKLSFKVRTDNEAAIALYRKYGVRINNPIMCPDNVERYVCELRLG
ncbi:MAG: GNAT family N-acetyltransferase [Nanoarchaeota archaeon]|nr:GNAT family N-acetyltransferase [Nanoarchaeota archaeon]